MTSSESIGARQGPTPTRGADEERQLAGFYVGAGLYGIEIMRIKEVIQAAPHPIRPVPLAPAIVEGVIQLRGVVIPVVDLRRRFGTGVDEAVLKKVGDTSFEELTCIGYNPATEILTAIVRIKQQSGYGGDACTDGSQEYVRFYLDYGDGTWVDHGVAGFVDAGGAALGGGESVQGRGRCRLWGHRKIHRTTTSRRGTTSSSSSSSSGSSSKALKTACSMRLARSSSLKTLGYVLRSLPLTFMSVTRDRMIFA